MKKIYFLILLSVSITGFAQDNNPIFPGWYADPEGIIFGDQYWVFLPILPLMKNRFFWMPFLRQTSPTGKNMKKYWILLLLNGHIRLCGRRQSQKRTINIISFFGANDIQSDEEEGGIGVAVSDQPGGPYKDHLGKPLIDKFHNGAQPIDQFVFKDKDGQYYLIYGGWKHCNIAKMNDDFSGFIPFEDGTTFKEITPESYVEGPFMFIKDGKYYFMWSEGGWTGPNYSVAYAIADSPMGPFKRVDKILQQDPDIANGAGHHSVIHEPKSDDYYIVYHRRPLDQTDGNSRETCIDRMYFDKDGFIKPVKITKEGVKANPLK